ncbi:hypothetical protein A0256_23985 [Mucilaginibacter sp. PAMC 26640]|nr:hypothetical protein A0256_23985 [Mucilaginibacter sp. PAMC 26640]
MYKIVFLPSVIQDIRDASYWYESKKAGLSKKFLAEVYNKISVLENSPYLFAVRYDGTRVAVLRTFPFMAHYIVNDETKTVKIIAILHTIRKPASWKR